MRPGSPVVLAGVVAALSALAATSTAGTVIGKLELPVAERAPVLARGFVDRIENPLADIRKLNIAPYLVVVLDGERRSDAAPPEVNWDLVGESFARPVVVVPVGAAVVIKNLTKVPRTLGATEDAKLISGPLNPTGSKSFRATQPAVYTITDKDAPYLRGKVVVVASTHVAAVDDGGRFEIADVPDGSYKLRVFYYDPAGEARGRASDWLPFSADVIVARGKAGRTEVNAKLPALPAQAAPGKK